MMAIRLKYLFQQDLKKTSMITFFVCAVHGPEQLNPETFLKVLKKKLKEKN